MTSRKPLYLVVAIAAAPLLSGLAMGQMHQHAGGATTQPMDTQQHREQMKQHMQKMQQEMKQMDQRLQEKVDAMHNAQGQAKIDAMAAVIDELVQQRQTRDKERMEMMNRMMQHMEGHDHMMQDGEHQHMMGGDDKGNE